MAINFTVSYTFTAGTTISSSQVNTNFSDEANVWTGLEGLTKTFAKLKVDVDPTTALEVATKQYVDHYSAWRRPVLQYSSGTVVNIETGINGTSGQAQILFPDGNLRTDSTTGRINCNLAQVAALSGSWQSGLRTGTVTNNTWYAIYAVKTTDDTSKFVTVADTVIPTQANFATLNSNFGTGGWLYLGMIPYGDNSGTANAIVKFAMSGNLTMFRNVTLGSAQSQSGPRLANQSVAGSAVTWTYASGTTISSAQIPGHITHGIVGVSIGTSDANIISVTDSSGTYAMWTLRGSTAGLAHRMPSVLIDGIQAANVAGTSVKDVYLVGFFDGVLGVGSNPQL